MHIVAAPDKFRGTASALEVTGAIARVAMAVGHTCDRAPMADGGEGTLDALGGANKSTVVTGPLGMPVAAPWRLVRKVAVIEMALASGLLLAGGAEENDPVDATTFGTGELIAAAVESGATRVIVGVGGSATTDGGLGALDALFPAHRLRGVDLIVACDVRTRFVDAAEVFAPQKGASPAQVELLRRRLERLVIDYRERFGFEVSDLEGSGAAGGLAGGLAAVGATILSGFDVVADEIDLADRVEGADYLITGEGFLDRESFDGKVVGGVVELGKELDVPVLAIVGQAFEGVPESLDLAVPLEVISLVELFGETKAMTETTACIEAALRDWFVKRA